MEQQIRFCTSADGMRIGYAASGVMTILRPNLCRR